MFIIDPYRSGTETTTSAYSGSAAVVTYGGSTNGWSGESQAVGSPDADFATSYGQVDGSSDWLVLKSYGFSIPTGAEITGIKVKLHYRITTTSGYGTNSVLFETRAALTRDGSTFEGDQIVLTVSAPSTPFETSGVGTYLDVESNYSLWGGSWTKTDVEATTFGVAIRDTRDQFDLYNNCACTIWGAQITVQYIQ